MEEALNLEEGVHIKMKALANEEGVTKFREALPIIEGCHMRFGGVLV